jgi:predicted nuclease of predicted toxin-antitoxin system
MLHFFADQCLPTDNCRGLEQFGKVTLLRTVLPIRSPDSEVIRKAQELDAILVTVNGDFAHMVEYPPRLYGGIIALQLHNHPETTRLVLKRLQGYVEQNPDHAFYRGKLFIVEAHRVRMRD